ncbi:hypothetical protein OR16_15289 [Cupriavidus basilensis OR16]|uniref:Uncharacterized protein n=1 Tax=Cupriavidus basilensis OR16 TaxID=1127483 RepID=H1S5D8_9BURK|nr:hypothetical protein [Cupriavidus basilensis]EHP42305.1 hypothetical protein OR16_15289 [Cupriavidus basilensis OR16]
MIDFAMTAPEIGAILGITARRVTQYRDDKLLPAVERGKFDPVFLLYLRKGEQRADGLRRRPDRDTLLALGWLGGVHDKPSDEDLAAFGTVFERNGLTRDAALVAIGRAMQLVTR